jgi:mRNA interferase RelE/StbE
MESYKIEWRKPTRKDFRFIPEADAKRIIAAVELLASNPYPLGCSKLTGSHCAYRIRVGDYRIIYEVWETTLIVEIIKVGHRRDVYR